MGEERRKRSTTQKFIQQFPQCCFCGGQRPSMTREHMPPKSLFDNSHRPDKSCPHVPNAIVAQVPLI
jgi:hypothetical protein